MATGLLIGNFHKLYDVGEVTKAMTSGGNKSEALTALYERMLKDGSDRLITSPSGADCLDGIDARCPNFREVSECVRGAIALALEGGEPVSLTPLLLLGESGIGKTHFAMLLANLLGTSFEFISMGSVTAGWVLGGASAQWKNAQPGKVARKLIHGTTANPVMVIDEVDKAGGDDRFDPFGSLLSLFEQDTATAFQDEYVEVPINAGPVLWVCTANDDSRIPKPVLNRMDVFCIASPTHEEAANIARTIYQEALEKHEWSFLETPAENVVDKLAYLPPRTLRRALRRAFGRAKLAKRDHLVPEDIRPTEVGQGRIGF